MAISLAFGILFATAITLFFVPSGYLVIEDSRALLRRAWAWYRSPFKKPALPTEPSPTHDI
jgi:hypothetical protein